MSINDVMGCASLFAKSQKQFLQCEAKTVYMQSDHLTRERCFCWLDFNKSVSWVSIQEGLHCGGGVDLDGNESASCLGFKAQWESQFVSEKDGHTNWFFESTRDIFYGADGWFKQWGPLIVKILVLLIILLLILWCCRLCFRCIENHCTGFLKSVRTTSSAAADDVSDGVGAVRDWIADAVASAGRPRVADSQGNRAFDEDRQPLKPGREAPAAPEGRGPLLGELNPQDPQALQRQAPDARTAATFPPPDRPQHRAAERVPVAARQFGAPPQLDPRRNLSSQSYVSSRSSPQAQPRGGDPYSAPPAAGWPPSGSTEAKRDSIRIPFPGGMV